MDRTSALGLFNYANSYRLPAEALLANKISATLPYAPISFLYYHAIELYLKSYLRSCGMTVDDLRSKFGHKAHDLALEASRSGLVLRAEDQELFQFMTSTNAVMEARYIATGAKQIPELSSLSDASLYLHKEIGPKAMQDPLPLK